LCEHVLDSVLGGGPGLFCSDKTILIVMV
jgi:hypothetical protein